MKNESQVILSYSYLST